MSIDTVALANVPASLKSRRQWLVWKLEPGEKKPKKMPYYANGRRRVGTQGDEADRAKLVDFDAAMAAAHRLKASGVGFAFLPGDGLIGIDLDAVIDAESGEISERAASIISACASYTEFSPSGTGVHIIVEGAIEASFKSNSIGVEVFCGGQYFTVTGKHWPDSPLEIRPIQEKVIGRLRATVDQAKGKTRTATAPAAPVSAGGGGGDDFKRVNELAMGALHAWVPALFPGAVARGKGWRVSSKSLGRDLEEDIGITAEGIVDFGVADMGDARAGKRTPIDLVCEWLPASKPLDALTWLARRVGLELATPARKKPPRPKRDEAGEREQPEGASPGPDPETLQTPPEPDGDDGIGDGYWRPAPPAFFHETENGGVKAKFHNLMLILGGHPAWQGVLGFDQYSELIVKLKPPPWHEGRFIKGGEWLEEDDYRLRHWLSTWYFEAKAADVMQAVILTAHTESFHPLIERLESTAWDGQMRLKTWLIDYLGACKGKRHERLPLDERDRVARYVEAVGVKWMVGAVARVYEAAKPGAVTGSQMDTMLILEGEQGIMKSSALRILGGAYFTDEKLDFGNKDSFMVLQGRHIVEMAELEGLNKAETSATKNFITKREDLFRLPYGKKLVKKPRRCAFAGTVNHDVYLKDDSGNRRFWPIYCTVIDIEGLARDVDQLWAEALHLYRQGTKWWVLPDERELFTTEQDKRFQEDPWQEPIEDYLIGKTETTTADVSEHALKIDKARWDKQGQMRIASCLKRAGWESDGRRASGRVRVWTRAKVGDTGPAQGPGRDDDEPF